MEEIEWILDPLIYKTDKSYGMLMGRFHYRFELNGTIKSLVPLQPSEAAIILKHVYKEDAAKWAAAGIRTIRESKK